MLPCSLTRLNIGARHSSSFIPCLLDADYTLDVGNEQDLRDIRTSIMRIHHPASVRSVVFSNSEGTALQVGVGLDSGSVYRLVHCSFVLLLSYIHLNRWDLQIGQRRHLDRLPLAHTGPILALDWSGATSGGHSVDETAALGGGGVGDGGGGGGGGGGGSGGRGWLASGGLDRTVKVRPLPFVRVH